jgi:hypothetical protein
MIYVVSFVKKTHQTDLGTQTGYFKVAISFITRMRENQRRRNQQQRQSKWLWGICGDEVSQKKAV